MRAFPPKPDLPITSISRFEPRAACFTHLRRWPRCRDAHSRRTRRGSTFLRAPGIDDWYDDGRVDRTYDLHCYDDAIDALPPDVRQYSSAQEDIERALQARMRGEGSRLPRPSSPGRDEAEDDDEPSHEITGATPRTR